MPKLLRLQVLRLFHIVHWMLSLFDSWIRIQDSICLLPTKP